MSVSHRGLDRIDTYNIFLNEKKKKSTYVTYGKAEIQRSECFVQVRQLVCRKKKDSNPVVLFAS